MDATRLLEKDHDDVRRLFEAIDDADDDVRSRSELFAEVAEALRIHARIEEELFYPRVQLLGPEDDDEGDDLVTEAAKEHHELDHLLREIEALDPASRTWTQRVKKLQRRVEHHAGEEEDEMFPFVRRCMSDDELENLGEELEDRRDALNPRSRHADAV